MTEVESKTPEYSIENDPLFKPISKDKEKKIDEAVKKKIKSLSLDENVDKDNEKLSGQNYALISVVSPQGKQQSDNICLKIKGVFNKLEEANKHAEILQKLESTFDIYVVEMYSWLLVPPDPTLIEQKHVDLKLNEIIGGHRESQLKAKMHFEERKKELLENIKIENDKRKEENEKLKEYEIIDVTDKEGPEGPEGPKGPKGPEGPEFKNNAVSNKNVTKNGNECPNSSPISEESFTPSDLMNSMLNVNISEKPSKSWADSVDE